MQPTNPNVYFGRAFAYKGIKKYQEAADDFEKATTLDPSSPQFTVNYRNMSTI